MERLPLNSRISTLAALVASTLFLAACGGGSTTNPATSGTVGGTVTGLASGASVVLQNNGGNDMVASANGPFTFSTPMASGGAYAVTVLHQPTSPAQTCTVANGMGMMGSGNVTNVAVTCVTNSSLVSGTVVKGPVSGATVTAYAVTNGTMGAQVGGGTTDSTGNFSISIGEYSGPMMIQASGGTYTDEATGTTMTMPPGNLMACSIPSVAAGATTSGIQITPVTTMAHSRVHHMTGGITDANIVAANAAMGAYFSVSDILHTVPMNPMVAGSGTGATQDAKNYGMANAAMSQYAMAIGMPNSSGIVTAMMDDASDGVMNGMMGTASITMGGGMMSGTMMQTTGGTSGLAAAMTAFVGSARNLSGVTMTAMQPLVDQLNASNGVIPGAGGGTTTGMMSGTAVKGPVGSATATAYAIVGGMMGAQLGSATTDASGNFSVPLGTYAGSVMLQMTGGTFTDEATNSTMPMLPGDMLVACVPAVASGSTTTGIQMTPLTTMASARAKAMTGGMTDANIAMAHTAVGTYFSVADILHSVPMNPMVAGSGASATQNQKNHGMSIAAMSQYAKTIGMATSSSGMVTAMMNDASDGVMDGMMGGTGISMGGMGGMTGGMMSSKAGTSGLSTAMGTFIGSTMNQSGVTTADMQALMTQLAGSDGQLPGAGGTVSPHGTMAGTAFMGEMSSGTVTAYSVSNGTMGPQIAMGSVDSSGNFTIPLGAYAGTVMLQMTGGSFMDPASGTTMNMQSGDVMTSCVPSVTAGSTTSGVQITPLTSMAQARAQNMSGGMTAANVGAANTAMSNYFLVGDILMTSPMDPSMAGSGIGADQNRKNYGMSIAAMSQYAKTVGMTVSSSGMVTAMMKDASDGTMNGKMGSTSISMGGMGGMMGGTMMQSNAGTTGLATAMTAFVGSSTNRSGVQTSDMQTLVNKLSTSTGTIQ